MGHLLKKEILQYNHCWWPLPFLLLCIVSLLTGKQKPGGPGLEKRLVIRQQRKIQPVPEK